MKYINLQLGDSFRFSKKSRWLFTKIAVLGLVPGITLLGISEQPHITDANVSAINTMWLNDQNLVTEPEQCDEFDHLYIDIGGEG